MLRSPMVILTHIRAMLTPLWTVEVDVEVNVKVEVELEAQRGFVASYGPGSKASPLGQFGCQLQAALIIPCFILTSPGQLSRRGVAMSIRKDVIRGRPDTR